MIVVKNIDQLIRIVHEKCPELANHQWYEGYDFERDDLPFFTKENLLSELRRCSLYVFDTPDDNLVPNNHGVGLISRALSIAKKHAEISPELFTHEPVERKREILSNYAWY
jgi:hypothetical protein